MTLVALNVYRQGKKFGSMSNHSTAAAWTVDDSEIKAAIPSVCKTDSGTHGLVNSLVVVDSGIVGNPYHLYCAETTAAIAALS